MFFRKETNRDCTFMKQIYKTAEVNIYKILYVEV